MREIKPAKKSLSVIYKRKTMNQQLELTFYSTSPIKIERLSGQNKRLYDYLAAGNTIHCFHPAIKELRIGYLNSRCADLSRILKEQGKDLFRRMIKVKDVNGDMVAVKEYSLIKFK